MPVPLENLRFSFEELIKKNGVKALHSQSNREKKAIKLEPDSSKPKTAAHRHTPNSNKNQISSRLNTNLPSRAH